MVTKTREKKKLFNIFVVKEKLEGFVPADRGHHGEVIECHGFEVKGTSDDPEMQEWDSVTASMAVPPKDSKLVVTMIRDKFYIERYPNISGSFVAPVVSTWKRF